MTTVEMGAPGAPPAVLDVPAQAYPLGRWTLFKNPFAKRGKPTEPVAPVQGELLLDLVKPVRNDLSDTDLEVVPANRRTAPAHLPVAAARMSHPVDREPREAAASSVRSEPAAWDEVKEQIFGAGKS